MKLSTKAIVVWFLGAVAVNSGVTLSWMRFGSGRWFPVFLTIEILSGLVVITTLSLVLFRLVRLGVEQRFAETRGLPWRVVLSLFLILVLGNAAAIWWRGSWLPADTLILTNVGLLSAWTVGGAVVMRRRDRGPNG